MQLERQPCVYILASKPYGTLYIGVTSNVLNRLYEHRTDPSEGFTKQYSVHTLVRYELFDDMENAILREKQLKRWRRRWKLNLIESENPDWHDLAVGLGLPSLT